jgi:hypothetical protein
MPLLSRTEFKINSVKWFTKKKTKVLFKIFLAQQSYFRKIIQNTINNKKVSLSFTKIIPFQ